MSDRVFCCNCKWGRKGVYSIYCYNTDIYDIHFEGDNKYQCMSGIYADNINKDGTCKFYKHSVRKSIQAYQNNKYPRIILFKRVKKG